MRKLFAALVGLAMVLSMGTGAFADGTEGYVSAPREAEITVQKLYDLVGAENEDLFPQETLNFVSAPAEANPDQTNLTIDPLTVSGNSDQKLTISLPSYNKVGTYHYTITETVPEQTAQGVTYSGDQVAVTVLVTYDYDNQCLQSQVVLGTGEAAEGKVDTFRNTYELGTLTLSKTVSGNLGDQSVYFDIHVTLSSTQKVASDITVSGGSHEDNPKTIAADSWTETEDGFACTQTFKLKHSDTLTFADVPAGITYKAEEDPKHLVGEDGFDVNSATDTDYTVAYDNGATADGTGAIESGKTTAQQVSNEKKTSVETGVLLDAMPYTLMLTAALAGIIVIFGKKRYEV